MECEGDRLPASPFPLPRDVPHLGPQARAPLRRAVERDENVLDVQVGPASHTVEPPLPRHALEDMAAARPEREGEPTAMSTTVP